MGVADLISPAAAAAARAAQTDGGIVSDILSKHGRSAQPESVQLVAVTRAVCEVVTQQGLQVGGGPPQWD